MLIRVYGKSDVEAPKTHATYCLKRNCMQKYEADR